MHGVNNHAMNERPRRHSQIAALLRQQAITSQDQLADLLAVRGIRVAQATLSRDLKSLGVVKSARGYFLPDAMSDPANRDDSGEHAELCGVLTSYVVSVATAASFVVLHTGPGHAQVVALELDRCRLTEVVGTIAGDDTIMVATPSIAAAFDLAQTLGAMASLEADEAANRLMADADGDAPTESEVSS